MNPLTLIRIIVAYIFRVIHPKRNTERKGQHSTWTKTIVASMTSYIDAGSIVAGGAGLALWDKYLKMAEDPIQLPFTIWIPYFWTNGLDYWTITTIDKIGLIGACSSNALSAAVGALIGGRICDLYGRKLVYTYDLLFYIIGMLLIVFGVNYPMLLIGYIIVGLSVGADVAASWTLIAENAPAENRARHCGTAQLMWALGPAVVLLLSAVLSSFGLGLLGNRIIFAHLVVIAFITWLMRLTMPESEEWITNKKKEQELIKSGQWKKTSYWDLFTNPANLRGLFLLIGVYMIWNLAAGTGGFFLPYIYEKVGGCSNAVSQGLSSLVFITSIFATLFIFMTLADKYSRRIIYFVIASLYIAAWGLLLLPAEFINTKISFTSIIITPTAGESYYLSFTFGICVFVLASILMGINNGSGQQAFYQMWGAEMFPARYRAAAQGFSFFTARFVLSIWSYLVPIIISKAGMPIAAAILVTFAAISMLIGTIFCPNTAGKTLEQIEQERYGE
ncbi:MAG: MFS transporter [Planctomycetaceae bacterium]|jgi:inositol transporter-like SP family MFS transporter|nr:MFS transporter [Planctomycetaceae bacterium]